MLRQEQIDLESMNKNPEIIKTQLELLKAKDFKGIFSFEDEAYFGGLGVSKSQLDDFSKSPKQYYAKHCLNAVQAPTKAMELGTLLHTAVLEPDKLENFVTEEFIFQKLPAKATRANKDYKEWKAIQIENGKKIVSKEDYDQAIDFVRIINSKPNTKALLTNGFAEKACYAIDPITKLLLRCKADYIQSSGTVTDVKSTKDASFTEFEKSIYNFRYQVQAAYYMYVISLVYDIKISDLDFKWICLEKGISPDVIVYKPDAGIIELGEKLFRRDLNALSDAMETKEFKGYNDKETFISIPHWAWKNYDEDLLLEG